MNRHCADAPSAMAPRQAAIAPARISTSALLLGVARRALLGAVDQVLVWHERAAQRRQLLMMDERMLKDIGLTRADIDLEACKPFWRP